MVDRPLTEREMLEEEYEALHGALPMDYRRVRAALLLHCEWPRRVRDGALSTPSDSTRPAGTPFRDACEAALQRELCGHQRRISEVDVRALCERLTTGRRAGWSEAELTPQVREAWGREFCEVLPRRELINHVHALDVPRSALCLSGGGIRSATFALGVLQGLVKRKLLGMFDFLSTISGGGYIGGWLSAWVHRDANGIEGVMRACTDTSANACQ